MRFQFVCIRQIVTKPQHVQNNTILVYEACVFTFLPWFLRVLCDPQKGDPRTRTPPSCDPVTPVTRAWRGGSNKKQENGA